MGEHDVYTLTPANFAVDAASSPLLWLISICWTPCGFCQALQHDWQRLAHRLRHEAVVAYWDAGASPELPRALGEVNVTPTVRALVPADDAPDGPFRIVDYHGDRTFSDLLRFALGLMPNFVQRVESVVEFERLERAPNTPKLLCFLGLAPAVGTPPMLRALSATYRGRLLVLEVRVHESAPAGHAIAARYGVSALPSVMALRAAGDAEPWRHRGPPTFRRLSELAAALLHDHDVAASGGAGPGAWPHLHEPRVASDSRNAQRSADTMGKEAL